MGARQAQRLATMFGLSGRVDLYHAFVLALARILAPDSVLGIIVSNRFMTTKSGASVREALGEHFNVVHAWDLGDTKLFDAAVLPAVILARGRSQRKKHRARFTSIYETTKEATTRVTHPVEALEREGVVTVEDGRHFEVRQGQLRTDERSGGWRLGTRAIDAWLTTVERRCWRTFGEVGKVRVGVKTCADKVFIRDDWDSISTGRPELLRPLTTHHVGQRYRPRTVDQPRYILYPHECSGGRRRAVDLSRYPRSQAYLETHRETLESRHYVLDARRMWYELWVPQDPSAWMEPKLVFRDIAEKPTFWVDFDGSVVNGDCYWYTCNTRPNALGEATTDDLLWLAAAVGNSTFIEMFYDCRFNNKLYSGRRRYVTQYVERFPLPDPASTAGRAIVEKARIVGACGQLAPDAHAQEQLDSLVWEAFDLSP